MSESSDLFDWNEWRKQQENMTPKLDKPPLSVAEAQRRNVCRFCQIDAVPSPENPLVLHWGTEYAHLKCIEEANRMGIALPVTSNPEPWVVAATRVRLASLNENVERIIREACDQYADSVTAELRKELEETKAAWKASSDIHRRARSATVRELLEVRNELRLAKETASEMSESSKRIIDSLTAERDSLRAELQKIKGERDTVCNAIQNLKAP